MIACATFETALGWAGVAWGEAGLVGVRLPKASPEAARSALARRWGGAVAAEPDRNATVAVAGIRRLLAGEKPDLLNVQLDLSATPSLAARVYAVARAIPAGETLTYGQVAERLAEPDADWRLAQAVGQALGANPWPIVVPCHRVTGAGGKLGGYSAPGGAATKLRLLAIEGAAAAGRRPAQGDLFG